MICDDMIVGAACMTHSAVEGSQARLIVLRPERRGLSFFYTIYNFFLQFFSGGGYPASLSQHVVATFLFSFYTLSSISIRTVVERGVYCMLSCLFPSSTATLLGRSDSRPPAWWLPHHTFFLLLK